MDITGEMVEAASRALFECDLCPSDRDEGVNYNDLTNAEKQHYLYRGRAALEAAISASPQDGWVLVPRQPTREMILAAWNAKEESGRAGFGKASWDAMLDALPQPTGDGT